MRRSLVLFFAIAVAVLCFAATNVHAQDVDGTWTEWSACTRLCDIGDSFRSCVGRQGAGADCVGPNHQTCNPQPCVNCTVSYLSWYSPCTKPCGTGTTWRARYIIQEPGPGGTPCPQLNFTYECNTWMCMETIEQYGYYVWGPFKGPGPISYTITRIDTEIDVFLFDEENYLQYQFDTERQTPYQTNYSPLRASLDIDTVKSEGPITLDPNTNYYLVVDHTYIGAADGTNNGNTQVFNPNRFYYEITGLDPGTGVPSGMTMKSAAKPAASLSTFAVVVTAIVCAFLF